MIYIRTDMNEIIATGHLMRCLAVADAARSCGEETTFILADEQAASMLEAKGYAYIVLHTAWKDMESELSLLENIIHENKIKSILVDSYQVTYKYFSCLRKLVKVVYLDDLCAFQYPVDGLICYANYWKRFWYEEQYTSEQLCLGTQYVPLRKEFSNCPKKRIVPEIRRLLFMSGGTDPCGILEQLLAEIDCEKFERVDVICGRYYKAYDKLCERYTEKSIRIHQSVTDIDWYMKEADLAVSAGGSTLYELCACGTPSISYAFADNQIDNVKQFQEDQLIDYAGDARYEDVAGNIKKYIEEYKNNYQLRATRSCEMQRLVDGKGAFRIANVLIEMGKEDDYDTIRTSSN